MVPFRSGGLIVVGQLVMLYPYLSKSKSGELTGCGRPVANLVLRVPYMDEQVTRLALEAGMEQPIMLMPGSTTGAKSSS